jgi:hypothetical protein
MAWATIEAQDCSNEKAIEMTNLGMSLVTKVGHNGIKLGVAGDLSHHYAVLPDYDLGNVGLKFPTKAMAIAFAEKTNHLSWSKQVDAYNKEFPWKYTVDNWRFGYLPEKMAVKYAADAYGDYAVKIRKKYGIRKSKWGGTKAGKGWHGEKIRHKIAALKRGHKWGGYKMTPKQLKAARLKAMGKRKAEKYLEKYGEFEAYNDYGGDTVEEGIANMEDFYRTHPEAPV